MADDSSLNGAEGGAEHVGLIFVPKGARVVTLPLAVAFVAEAPEKVRLALEVGAGLKWRLDLLQCGPFRFEP